MFFWGGGYKFAIHVGFAKQCRAADTWWSISSYQSEEIMLIQLNIIEKLPLVKYFVPQYINANLSEVEHHLLPHYTYLFSVLFFLNQTIGRKFSRCLSFYFKGACRLTYSVLFLTAKLQLK